MTSGARSGCHQSLNAPPHGKSLFAALVIVLAGLILASNTISF